MYPGVNNTELCPTRFFSGEPLYRDGRAPDDAESSAACDAYWRPYHDALAAELARLRAAHGHAMLLDGHSIQAELPWLFEGRLPDLNLGTAERRELRAGAARRADGGARRAVGFSHVVDGRFKGGYITRHYGRPAEGVHAVQLEMCWDATWTRRTPPSRSTGRRPRSPRAAAGAARAAADDADWRANAG